MCTHGIGSHGSTPQLATASPAAEASGGGAAPATAVAGASGLAASAPELGAILLQLTKVIETLVQALGGASALTQAPSTFAGSNAAPVAVRGGGGVGGDTERTGRAKAKGDKQGDTKPKHDHATDHGNRNGRGNGPRATGNGGNRTPAPAPAPSPSPAPAPAPTPAPTPPADNGGLSQADRTRLGNERDTLTAEARRLREQLGKYGGGAGTTTAVNRLETIDRRLREINELLN